MARVLYLAGQLPLIPAELIDHDARRPVAPARGITAEYGQYLAVGCAGCHGEDFSGSPVPGAPPGTIVANLTRGGDVGQWTEVQFAAFLRSGVTPDGRAVDQEWMPIGSTKYMTGDEIAAVWLYLQSLPPR